MRPLAEYPKRRVLAPVVTILAMPAEVGLLLLMILGSLGVELPRMVLDGALVLASALIQVGLFYVLFRRTGTFRLGPEYRTQQQIVQSMLRFTGAGRDLALASLCDDYARDLLGYGIVVSGVTFWMAWVLPTLGDTALYALGVVYLAGMLLFGVLLVRWLIFVRQLK